jgi:hypothetical protein
MPPIDKPAKLYHGSETYLEGPLTPVLLKSSPDHAHDRAAVFATEREDVAALFMFPFEFIASIGFENDTAYIYVWGTPEEFAPKDHGGFIYVLPGGAFQKIGKEYEWQSFEPVAPIEVKQFDSAFSGMMRCGEQVYFVNDDAMFDRVVAEKHNRAPFLKDLISENQKLNLNVQNF